jgi:hypothetical protein
MLPSTHDKSTSTAIARPLRAARHTRSISQQYLPANAGSSPAVHLQGPAGRTCAKQLPGVSQRCTWIVALTCWETGNFPSAEAWPPGQALNVPILEAFTTATPPARQRQAVGGYGGCHTRAVMAAPPDVPSSTLPGAWECRQQRAGACPPPGKKGIARRGKPRDPVAWHARHTALCATDLTPVCRAIIYQLILI